MRKTLSSLWTLLSVGLLFAVRPTHAQNYFSFSTGTARTFASDLHILNSGVGTDAVYHNVGWSLASDRSTFYYGIRFGGYFKRQPHWGIEFNYNHNKASLNSDRVALLTGTWNGQPVNGPERIEARVQAVDVLNGENIFAVNLLYRTTGRSTPSFSHGRFQAYIGLGPAFYMLYNTNKLDRSYADFGFEYSGIGCEVLWGARYGLFKKVALYVEGRYTHCDMSIDGADGGKIETPLRSLHLMLGVLYEF